MKAFAFAIVAAGLMALRVGVAAPLSEEIRSGSAKPEEEESATKGGPAVKAEAELPGSGRGQKANYLITVADDFVVEIYKNGERVPEAQRTLILERFGATAEKVSVAVRSGDWLVFQVVHDRLRWNGSKYFAVAGCLGENEFGFVSDPASADWSACDDPAKVGEFIRRRGAGTGHRARTIDVAWGEGDGYVKEFAGDQFSGTALWGGAPSTWIKYVAGRVEAEEETEPAANPERSEMKALTQTRRWPVQIISAVYGTGGKNADVTAKVKEYVEVMRRKFSANPKDLGADPNPYWNKGLHVVYMKDGVRREQRRNENETVLPESFYGPQDAAELRAWLAETRWFGSKPDIQFHADQTVTSPGVEATARWETVAGNKLRLTWPGEEAKEFVFGYTWESLSQVGEGKNVYHLAK